MDRMPCKNESIKNFDWWYKVFVHEVFHVFGIAHTMKRTDRDNYIKLSENLSKRKLLQYTMNADIPMPGGGKIPYECNSIMHYGPGSKENPRFEAIDPTTCKFHGEKAVEPTPNDWKAIKYKVCHPLKGAP